MKPLFILLLAAVLSWGAASQNVPRNMVILEIGTGLGCTYCPGATRAADSLITLGKSVAVIEYHYADSLTTNASMNRIFYYNYQGIPVGNFDGALQYLGGEPCPDGNVFSAYLPLYEARIAIPSPLLIGIAGFQSGNTWDLTLSVLKVGPIASPDLKLHLVVTENHVPSPPWPGAGGCMTENNYLERCMVPDHLGTPLSFTTGDMQVVNLSFTKPAYWNTGHIELVAFVQDNLSKEILNGSKVMLTALPSPMTVDFTAGQTSGCAPYTTTFTPLCPGADSYQWTFQNGTPSASQISNPAVTYTATGTSDVTLIAWNSSSGVGNFISKPGFITTTALPGVPGTPLGSYGLCINPSDQTYITSGSSGAVSYVWDLFPSSAGTLTPLGTSCMVNFEDSWTGTAFLKVRGENSCGAGLWSSPLTITVNAVPDPPAAPIGPTHLCMHAQNTLYTTTGSPGATGYSWELLPAGAGSLIPTALSCTIHWSPTFTGYAQLHVKAINQGCEGAWSSFLNITVVPGPATFSVTGGGSWCALGGNGVPVGLENSETGYSYTLLLNGVSTMNTLQGTGTALDFGNQTSPGSYSILAQTIPSGCENMMDGEALVVMDPHTPEMASKPEGPVQVYSGASPVTEYYTPGAGFASDYTWKLVPAGAGIHSGNGQHTLVNWNPDFQGFASLQVAGNNSCGQGIFSDSLVIMVEKGVGLDRVITTGKVAVCPNPCRDYILISHLRPGSYDISVYSVDGVRILAGCFRTSGEPVRIETSSWVPGVYDLSVSSIPGGKHFRVVRER